MILVTGASGQAGGAVLRAALDLRLPVRAMYRNDHEALAPPPGASAVVANFADRSSLMRALQGVETVYLVCGAIPQLVELESSMLDACKAAGVRHVVLSSALGAGDFRKSFPSWHRQVEDKLRSSEMDATIIRPNGFMQNIVAYDSPSIRKDRAFYAAMGDAAVSLIDVRDLGAVVATVLSEPSRHAGRIYELNGPEAVRCADIAKRISEVIGETVSFVDIPEEAQRSAMLGMGMPQWQVTAVLELQEYYRSGRCAQVDTRVQDILGRPARTLAAFLRENADAFRAPAGEPAGQAAEPVNPTTGMTLSEMKNFIRNHFEQFVNQKNLDIVDVNFADGFVDHGADVPPGLPPGRAGAKQYLAGAFERFPDIRVTIEDMIAADDKVVVRNIWRATNTETKQRLAFSGIVIWRIAARQIHERWAYLEAPHPVE